MKTLLVLLSLLTLVSCGQGGNEPNYMFETRLDRVWHKADGSNLQLDLRDLNSVTITGPSLLGMCTYSVEKLRINEFYGVLIFTLTDGESDQCSKFVGRFGSELMLDTREGVEKLTLNQDRYE